MIFVGMAVGPTLGSLIRRETSQPLSVFYFAMACHALFALVSWTMLPESVSSERMKASKQKHAAEMNTLLDSGGAETNRISRALRSLVSFARPLAILLPKNAARGRASRKLRKDWSLTVIAIGYTIYLTVMVRNSVRYGNHKSGNLLLSTRALSTTSFSMLRQSLVGHLRRFAFASIFHKLQELIKYFQLGYMLSTVGIARVVTLTALVPRECPHPIPPGLANPDSIIQSY